MGSQQAYQLFNNQSARILIVRLLKNYARPYFKTLFLGFLCLLVLSVTSVAPAKLLEDVVNEIFVARNSAMLIPVTAFIFGAFLLKGLANYGSSVTMEYVGQRIIADIQKDLFNHLIYADLAFFHNTPTGELISRFSNDVSKLQNAVTGTLSSLAKDTLTLVFFIGLMFYQDWLLAFISFFILPVAILPLVKIGKRMRKASTSIQAHTAGLTVFIGQVFQTMRVVKAYCMEEFERIRINEVIEIIFKRTYKAVRIRAATHPLMEFLGGVAIAVVVLYGGSQVIEGQQTAGAFFSFIAALMMAYEPLKRLANLNANLQEQLAAATRVFAVMDQELYIKELPDALVMPPAKGDIAFKEVNFTYPDSARAVLDKISFRIRAGQKAAFVGASGAGKSTLLNLIPRFYDAISGTVEIDGMDVKSMTLKSLRNNISLVSQEIMLFDSTIRENIAYGRLDATIHEVENAAKAAAAHEFIVALNDGYDTLVGEQGIKVSGGQRQRIAIARAMLKNAPVLLLDEPTSALDSESEQKIQQALNKLMQGRTTLVIAHRLTTVMDADIIFVMDKGKIISTGTHQELFARCPKYNQLCKAQLQGV